MYFIRRIIFAVPLLIVISALAFGLVHLAPGGPFDRERQPDVRVCERVAADQRADRQRLGAAGRQELQPGRHVLEQVPDGDRRAVLAGGLRAAEHVASADGQTREECAQRVGEFVEIGLVTSE